jgi:hypothetical protein
VQKPNSSRTSKQTSILHTPSNPPSHPPFFEALYFPLQNVGPTIFYFLFFSSPSHLFPTLCTSLSA